jgi:hypothetical protein
VWRWLINTWPFRKTVIRVVTPGEIENSLAQLVHPDLADVDLKALSIAKLLMEENRRICEWKRGSIIALEKKATNLVAAAGTGLALLAAFNRDLPFSYNAVPVVLLVIAVILLVIALYVREGALPSFGNYVSEVVLKEPCNEPRLYFIAARAWSDYAREIEATNRTKARYVRSGAIWLVIAIIAALVVVFISAPRAAPQTAPARNSRSLQDVRGREDANKPGEPPPAAVNAASGLDGRRQAASGPSPR